MENSADKGGKDHPKKVITVSIDGIETEIERGKYSTEQLIEALGVEPGYLLNVRDNHNQLVPLKPGEEIHVKKDMMFVSQVPCGGSS